MADIYTKLARDSIENYLKTGKKINIALNLPENFLKKKAGVFVSLHKKDDHSLRGCIGTFVPTKKNIAQEIINNALSAAFYDPRFLPVELDELENLEISVDVLSKPEEIKSKNDLDPEKFGIIVSGKSGHQGLLLPDIKGIDTVEQQIKIACQKAGLDPQKDKFSLKRFIVERHRE